MMKKNQITFLYLLIISFIYTVQGQINDLNYYYDNLPKSPTSYIFEKFGSVQNSEYTGSNSPSIPLINIKDGDINIPINLQYISGNGIRARDEASSVGLGWVIGLPNISQTVLGGYDDLNNYYKLKLSFMYDTTPPSQRNPLRLCETDVPTYLQSVGRDKFTYFKTIKNMLPVDGKMKMFNTDFTSYDTSPDLFVCNLFGEKIYFVTSNFETVSNMPYNFSPTFKSINKKGYLITYDTVNRFKIIDPKGIKYFFSKFSEYGAGDNLSGRDFYLTSVIDKNNNIVNLSYDENTNIVNIPTYTQGLNYTSSLSSTSAYDFPLPDSFPPYCHYLHYKYDYFKFNEPNVPNVSFTSPYYGNPIDHSFAVPASLQASLYQSNILNIKQIEGNFGKLVFSNSPRIDYPSSKKLDEMTLTFKNNTVKTIKFNYSYFDSKSSITVKDRAQQLGIRFDYSKVTNDQLAKRLKLNSILINNNDSYNFFYDETFLVNKDSFAIDYWGYFNGEATNKTLFANPNDFNVNIPLNNDYNNNVKTSNLTNAKSGILTKIIYPTKGYSIYEYELNKANNLFTDTSTVIEGQGLRLKKQSNYSNDTSFLGSIIFDYEGGKAINPLDLFKDYQYMTYAFYDVFSYHIKSTLVNSDNNVSPLSSGNILGYSKVTKTEIDGNGISRGKTITTYFNNVDVRKELTDDNIPVYIPTIKNNDYQDNGIVKEIEYYNSNNDIVKKDSLIYENVFPESYEFYGSSLVFNHNIFYNAYCNQPNDCNLYPTPISSFSYYPIYMKKSRLIGKVIKEYLNNKEITTTENYNYNNYDLLSSKSTHSSANNLSEEYSYTYSLPNFLNKNILSEPNRKTIYKNGTKIYDRRIQYLTDNSHYNPAFIKETPQNGAENTVLSFDRYDSNGNLLQYTTESGIPVTIIWGYNNKFPIAKIEGATYPDPNNPKPDTDLSQTQINNIVGFSNTDAGQMPNSEESVFLTALDNFRKDPLNSKFLITTYTYDPLIGVRSITPPSGITEFYKYDTANRLERILDKENNIIKEFKYNYAPKKYYNVEKSQTFTRNNCGSGYTGGTYTYTVPANKYSSDLSQADADQQAQNDINANGQTAANTYGTCTYLIDCGFTTSSIIPSGNVLTSSVKLNDNTVNFNLSFSPQNVNAIWSNPTLIGYIPNPGCRPAANIYSNYDAGNNSWNITTQPNGTVIIQLTGGNVNSTTFLPPITIVYSYTK